MDFSEEHFLEHVKRLGTLGEAISYANTECDRVEAANRKLRSRAARDRSFGPSYRAFLGRFLHYVQHGYVASGSSESEIQTFNCIVKGLKRK